MANVVFAQITPESGKPPIRKFKLHLVQGLGIEGDGSHSIEGQEVCVFRAESLEWEKQQDLEGVCFRENIPNLVVKGLPEGSIKPGARLIFPRGELRVAEVVKECRPDRCDRAKAGEECLLKGEYQLCRIVSSGIIEEGDEVICL